jgi:hypothetical protein
VEIDEVFEMRYVDHIKSYINESKEGTDTDLTSFLRKRKADDIRSGKMSTLQRIARNYSKAKSSGDDTRADMFLKLYKKLGG